MNVILNQVFKYRNSVAALTLGLVTATLFQNCGGFSTVDESFSASLVPPAALPDPGPVAELNVDLPAKPALALNHASIMLWRNYRSRQLGYWVLSDQGATEQAMISSSLPEGYQPISFVATPKLGHQGVLFYKIGKSTGEDPDTAKFSYWNMGADGRQVPLQIDFELSNIPARVAMITAADFDNNGVPDLLMRDHDSGQLIYTLLEDLSGRVKATGTLEQPVSLEWRCAGAVELDGDGRKHLIFHNEKSGQISIWKMNGLTVLSKESIAASADSSRFYLGGVYRNLGKNFFVWRDLATGDSSAWIVGPANSGTYPYAVIDGKTLASGVGFDWKIQSGENHYKYINAQSQRFGLPNIAGVRYVDTVPDTLDLSERALLATHVLTQTIDDKNDFDLFWAASLFDELPYMEYEGMGRLTSEYLDGLAQMRKITGDGTSAHVDQGLLNELNKNQSPVTGLILYPVRGKSHLPGYYPGSGVYFISDIITQARSVLSLNNYKQLIGMDVFSGFVRDLLSGIHMISFAGPDYYGMYADRINVMDHNSHSLEPFAAAMNKPPAVGSVHNGFVYRAAATVETSGMMIQGLAGYAQQTGDPVALSLANGYSNYMRKYSNYFDPDTGAWKEDGADAANYPGTPPHFSRHTKIIDSILDYALAAKNSPLVNWTKSAFLWGRNHPSSNLTLGYFPEYTIDNHHAETDELAEMIIIAAKISRYGYGDHWDDVDRWTRNHFAATQLTSTAQILDARQKGIKGGNSCPVNQGRKCVRRSESEIANRHLGAWPGWSMPNDFVRAEFSTTGALTSVKPGIMACCHASATRTLFYIWDSIAESFRDDQNRNALKVNLLMNRATPNVDIYSYVPFEGKVVIKAKSTLIEPLYVYLRVPEWIPQQYVGADLKVTIDGAPTPWIWQDRYLKLTQALVAGQSLQMNFPITNKVVQAKVAGLDLTLQMRGNNVIGMSPAGKVIPLYQDYVIQDGHIGLAKTKQVHRFVHASQR